jgi:hypothetical protein
MDVNANRTWGDEGSILTCRFGWDIGKDNGAKMGLQPYDKYANEKKSPIGKILEKEYKKLRCGIKYQENRIGYLGQTLWSEHRLFNYSFLGHQMMIWLISYEMARTMKKIFIVMMFFSIFSIFLASNSWAIWPFPLRPWKSDEQTKNK